MRQKFLKQIPICASLLFSVFLFSCKENQVPEDMSTLSAAEQQSSNMLKTASVDHPGRYLAGNCFQCHGTNGYAGELKIAGEGSSEIISKFNSFKSKDPKANIMNVHAQAYTTDEIKLIADFFSKQ